jgi:hypothetical protein
MYVYPISDIDPEINALTVALTQVCSLANWSYCGFDPSIWPAVPAYFRAPEQGILIVVSPTATNSATRQAADSLASVLRDDGLRARVSTAFASPRPPSDDHLRVVLYSR